MPCEQVSAPDKPKRPNHTAIIPWLSSPGSVQPPQARSRSCGVLLLKLVGHRCVPLRYRGSHRPTGAYMRARWRARSGGQERRGRGTPHPGREERRDPRRRRGLCGIGAITLVCCWRARRPHGVVSPVGCWSEYLGTSREHTCDPERRSASRCAGRSTSCSKASRSSTSTWEMWPCA
jgi:hypothetical protein